MFNPSQLLDGNYLKVPFTAHLHFVATSVEDLKVAVDTATTKKHPILILGSTSNVILTRDWHGVCIQPNIKGIELISETDDEVIVSVGSGEILADFINQASLNGWHGLENLIGIPGWVGSAIVQNVGAFGSSVSTYLQSVEVIDVCSGKVMRKYPSTLQMAYRDSIFKRRPDNWIIVRVFFTLRKKFTPIIKYHRLKEFLLNQSIEISDSQNINPELMMDSVLVLRAQTAEQSLPNVGSVFLNPRIAWQQLTELLSTAPDIKYFKLTSEQVNYNINNSNCVMVSAGSLIENLNYKGLVCGDAQVSFKSAVVLTKTAQKPATCFLKLIATIKQDVKKHYNIELQIEPRII